MMTWTDKLNGNPVDWLLSGNPWSRYKTYTDLLDVPETDIKSLDAKKALTQHPGIVAMAEETANWLTVAATRNNDPKISYFKLKTLAEFGLRSCDLDLQVTVQKASEHIMENLYAVRGSIPERPDRGGKYEKVDLTADNWHISPCNAPLITSALLELGVKDELVKRSVQEIKNRWIDKKGWFCHFFFVDSQFKKLQIGCPVAGLQALEIFSKIPELRESDHAKSAFEPIKFHKDYGHSIYFFGRSKKFWTLKYPFVWYNALYLADVLSRFEFLKEEEVVKELIEWIISIQDENGRFTPTSIFMHYKGWDFSNKKEASPWITFLCCRILKRYYSH